MVARGSTGSTAPARGCEPALDVARDPRASPDDPCGGLHGDPTVAPRERQSLGYDPYDFRSFGSAHGTEMELAELIRKAHALRIQVSRSNTSAGRASGARGPGGP